MTGAYLYISLLSSGGCFGAWIDHLDSFKNPNPRHSKVGFLKVTNTGLLFYSSAVFSSGVTPPDSFLKLTSKWCILKYVLTYSYYMKGNQIHNYKVAAGKRVYSTE